MTVKINQAMADKIRSLVREYDEKALGDPEATPAQMDERRRLLECIKTSALEL